MSYKRVGGRLKWVDKPRGSMPAWKPPEASSEAVEYVKAVRRRSPPDSTWFDVAQAYDAGRAAVNGDGCP